MRKEIIDVWRGVDEWTRRAAALVPLRDRVELLSPPILVEKLARYTLTRHQREVPSDDPAQRDGRRATA